MRIIANADGTWKPIEGLDREAVRKLALGPVPVWIRAESVAESEWDDLGHWFDLHPLALEDIRNPRQRPKVEDYGDVTFIVLRMPRFRDGELGWAQVGIFLGDGYVVTATPNDVSEMDTVEARLLHGGWKGDDAAVDRVMYHIVDALVDSYFPMMDTLEEALEELEDDVLVAATRDGLQAIRDFKSLVSRMRKIVPPMREATLNLERAPHTHISQDTRLYLRDVSDHMVRIAERLDHVKEVALIAQETWNSTLAAQQNETMKRLTVIFALFLVPTFLSSIGGMNFEGIPEWSFWSVAGALLAFVVLGYATAKMQKWV